MRYPLIPTWLLAFLGGGQSASDKATLYLKRQLTQSELNLIATSSQDAMKELQDRFGAEHIPEPIRLFQRWFDDGGFAKCRDLTKFGYAWGNILANDLGADWVVAQFEGTEYFGLNVPSTSITIAPVSMLEKRQHRGDRIDFQAFISNTLDAVREMEKNPEYQRHKNK